MLPTQRRPTNFSGIRVSVPPEPSRARFLLLFSLQPVSHLPIHPFCRGCWQSLLTAQGHVLSHTQHQRDAEVLRPSYFTATLKGPSSSRAPKPWGALCWACIRAPLLSLFFIHSLWLCHTACGIHPSFWTRDRTHAHFSGSGETQPLDHRRIPRVPLLSPLTLLPCPAVHRPGIVPLPAPPDLSPPPLPGPQAPDRKPATKCPQWVSLGLVNIFFLIWAFQYILDFSTQVHITLVIQ